MNRKPSLGRARYSVFLQVVAFVFLCCGVAIARDDRAAGAVVIVVAVFLWAVGFGYRGDHENPAGHGRKPVRMLGPIQRTLHTTLLLAWFALIVMSWTAREVTQDQAVTRWVGTFLLAVNVALAVKWYAMDRRTPPSP